MSRFIKARSYIKKLDKYKDHPSTKLIKAKINSQIFKFSQFDIEEVKMSFQSPNQKKSAQKNNIKTNLLKINVDIFAKPTYDDFNDSILFSKFPRELKQTEIVSALKKSQSFLMTIIDLSVFSGMFLIR